MNVTYLEPDDLEKLDGAKFAFDTETTGLSWVHNKMIGLGIWCPEREIYGYIPTYTEAARVAVRDKLAALGDKTTFIAHNAKFDFHFLGLAPDHNPNWTIVDTTYFVFLIDSRLPKNAEWVEKKYLHTKTKEQYVLQMPKLLRKKIWLWPVRHVAEYCMNDCRIEYGFAKALAPEITKLNLWSLFRKDMEFLCALWETERKGWLLDVERLKHSKKLLEQHVLDLSEELYSAVGYRFNWRSHQQLSKALYQDLGIERPKNPFADEDGVDRSRFKDKGKYNSAMTATIILLTKVNDGKGHPLGENIAQLREASKMLENVNKWLVQMDQEHCVHTNFNGTKARTGRITSSEPNIQNVPSDFRARLSQHKSDNNTIELQRTEEYNLREAYIARPGKILISVDWEQMEMRMFGIRSGDPFMLTALKQGLDIHGEIAERCWGTREDAYREWSKIISFGLIYGMTTGSLQFKLNLSHEAAQKIVDDYFATFIRIQPWLKDMVNTCQRYGFVRYWSGRLWREDDPSFMYKAANADIQGGCFDVFSVCAIRVRKWLKQRWPEGEAHIINYVHDEIILEVPDNEEFIDEAVRGLTTIMRLDDLFKDPNTGEQVPWFNSPKIGYSYGSFHEYQKPWLIVDNLSAKTLGKMKGKYPLLDELVREREREENLVT